MAFRPGFRTARTVLAFLVGHGYLLACTCRRIEPACEATWKAEAVFVGRPESFDPITIFGIPLAWPWPSFRRVRFAVSERFVGAEEKTIEVTSGMGGGGDCGIGFQRGRDYLVYAYRNSVTRQLYTGVCTRTSYLENAVGDLSYLRSLTRNPPPARLYGFVTRSPADAWLSQKTTEPLASVPIRIKSNNHEWKVQTDAGGAFDFPALPAGTFSLSADLPDLLRGGETRAIALHEHGCSEQILMATERASLSGKLLDHLNNPVSATVHLIPTTPGARGRVTSGFATRDGAFTISHVPPGEYLLGVNIYWPPRDGQGLSMPWQPTYFPGVQAKADAQSIHVASAQHLEGFEFRLPPRLKRRTVTGVVTWPNGKPAMAFVELKDAAFESNVNLANSGRDGTFTVTGVADRPYSIAAVIGLNENETPVHSAKVNLGLSENGPVHLVLSIPGKN